MDPDIKLQDLDGNYVVIPREAYEFLRKLREKDIEQLNETIALGQTVKAVSKIVRWGVVGVMGAFVALASFGSALSQLKVFFMMGK